MFGDFFLLEEEKIKFHLLLSMRFHNEIHFQLVKRSYDLESILLFDCIMNHL